MICRNPQIGLTVMEVTLSRLKKYILQQLSGVCATAVLQHEAEKKHITPTKEIYFNYSSPMAVCRRVVFTSSFNISGETFPRELDPVNLITSCRWRYFKVVIRSNAVRAILLRLNRTRKLLRSVVMKLNLVLEKF